MVFKDIAGKWQERWKDRFNARAEPGAKKFFVTAPFPYPNSLLSVEASRSLVIADVIARYKRMDGYNVLYPLGFQYTGSPIMSTAEAIRRSDRDVVEKFVSDGIPEEEVVKLNSPQRLADFFSSQIERDCESLGLSIDWSRKFTTQDPAFESFVKWQYKKLFRMGLVEPRDDYLPYCPNDGYTVGMHDTKGYVDPEVYEMTVIMFRGQKFSFPVSTVRPELILGACAILLNPSSSYSIVEESGRKMVMSSRAAYKLSFQKNIRVLGEITPQELEGENAVNPLTGEDIHVVLSDHVEPSVGTGVTIAAPAHEPLDYIALSRLKREFNMVPVISTQGLGEYPGADAAEAGTVDEAELVEFVESIRREEYYRGRIREDVAKRIRRELSELADDIAGKPVPEARQSIISMLKRLGVLDRVWDLANGPVYCRCGSEIVVKHFTSQWFIKYSDKEWKRKTLETLTEIKVFPENMKKDLKQRVEGSRDVPIARPRGMGPKIPWDNTQVFDSLSDSTLYTAFYTISNLVRTEMDDRFWESVFSGSGPESQEFRYWYPLDMRQTGSYLLLNHIPYMMFHHAALMPDYLPRAVSVNGTVRVRRRRDYPVRDLISKFGPDPVRSVLVGSAIMTQDIDLDEKSMQGVVNNLERLFQAWTSPLPIEKRSSDLDGWISSLFRYAIEKVREAYDRMDLYRVVQLTLKDALEWYRFYMEMAEFPNNELLRKIKSIWIRLSAPVIPFMAEEAWARGNFSSSLVSEEHFPTPQELEWSPIDLARGEYMRRVLEVVHSLSKKHRGTRAIIIVERGPPPSTLPEYVLRALSSVPFDELEAARWSRKFIVKATSLDVEVYNIWEVIEDPFGKKKEVSPWKPGVIIM